MCICCRWPTVNVQSLSDFCLHGLQGTFLSNALVLLAIITLFVRFFFFMSLDVKCLCSYLYEKSPFWVWFNLFFFNMKVNLFIKFWHYFFLFCTGWICLVLSKWKGMPSLLRQIFGPFDAVRVIYLCVWTSVSCSFYSREWLIFGLFWWAYWSLTNSFTQQFRILCVCFSGAV